jgi:hypothetical protein
MNETLPGDLNAAIAAQSPGLQVWVLVLVITNLAAALFLVTRKQGRIALRPEALAILVSFFAAAAFMNWLHAQVGFVRLLGLPHLVFWLPVYCWLVFRYRAGTQVAPFRYYLLCYFVIDGISLLLDATDVARYLLGFA